MSSRAMGSAAGSVAVDEALEEVGVVRVGAQGPLAHIADLAVALPEGTVLSAQKRHRLLGQ